MRVLQLVPSLSVGGAERIVGLLAVALRDLGHQVHVVSLAGAVDSWIERDLRARQVPLSFLDKGPGLDLRAVPRLARVLRRERPEVVHSHLHTLKYLLPAQLVGGRCPVVHTLHNLAEHEAVAADRALQRRVFFRWVEPVAIGEAVAESAARLYGRRPRFTIPNGVDVAAFARPPEVRDRVRAELGLPLAAPVFVAVGRLNPQKNHAALLRAFAQADPAALDAHLLLAGDGELRAELEAQARAPALAGRVHLLGVRRDVPDLLAAADVFALSSDYEGNPLVVMEALAAGRAVLATAVGCVPELVSPDTGRLVPAGDDAALAAAIAELAADPLLVARLGRGGLSVARARFDAAVMAQAYVQAYQEVA